MIDSDQLERRKAYMVGVALVFGAALLWSLNGSLIKILMDCEDPPSGLAIAFYRSLFAGLFFVPLGFRKLHTLKRQAGRKGVFCALGGQGEASRCLEARALS